MAQVTVRPSGQGGDYTTLASAISSNETDILLDGSSYSDENIAATIDDANTTIAASGSGKHPGYRGASPSHARFSDSGGNHVFTIDADGVTLDGLDIEQDGNGGSDECVRINADKDNATIKNCLFKTNQINHQDGVYYNGASGANVTITVENCIFWDGYRVAIHMQLYNATHTCTLNVNSCTIRGRWGNGESSGVGGGVGCRSNSDITANINVFNTISIISGTSSAADDFDANSSTVTWDIHDSIDGDGSITNRDSGASGCLENYDETDSDSPGAGDWVVFEETDNATADCRLKDNAENSAQDMHSNSSGAGITMPSTDIIGTSRPQNTDYDCGAFEIEAEAGTTLTFSSSAIGESDTAAADIDVTRTLLADVMGESDIAAIDLIRILALAADALGESDTSAASLANLIALAADMDGESDMAAIDLVRAIAIAADVIGQSDVAAVDLVRIMAFAADALGESDASDITLTVTGLIEFVAAIEGESDTSAANLAITRTIAAAIEGESDVAAVDLAITRALIADVVGKSDTPGITLTRIIALAADALGESETADITLSITGIIEFVAACVGESATAAIDVIRTITLAADALGESETAAIDLGRILELAAAIEGESDATATALSIVVSFAAAIEGEIDTPAIDLIRTLAMAADALGESDTADVVLSVMRELAADIDGESNTSLMTLITAGLGVILDPSSESLTVKRYMDSLTTKRTTSKV